MEENCAQARSRTQREVPGIWGARREEVRLEHTAGQSPEGLGAGERHAQPQAVRGL